MALPNDSITVTPGAGATVATHAVSGKEYQVVMLAGPGGHLADSLPTYSAYVDAAAFAANKHFLSILNTEAVSVVKLHKLFLINLQIAAVTGVMVRFEVRRATAHSGGSLVTPEAFDSANPSVPAGVTVRTAAASVTEGALLFSHAINNDEVGATGAFPMPQFLAGLNLLPESGRLQEFTLRQNQGLTVKMVTSTTIGSFGVLCVFTIE